MYNVFCSAQQIQDLEYQPISQVCIFFRLAHVLCSWFSDLSSCKQLCDCYCTLTKYYIFEVMLDLSCMPFQPKLVTTILYFTSELNSIYETIQLGVFPHRSERTGPELTPQNLQCIIIPKIYYLFYLLYDILSTLKSPTRRDYTVLMYALHFTCMLLFVHTTSTSSAVSQLLLLRGPVCNTLQELSLYKHFNYIFRLVVSVASV